jgi:hypothetical protein
MSTPIGLAANKQIMDTKFNKLTMKGSAHAPDTGGTIYKAAYHAYYDKLYEQLSKHSDPTDQDIYQNLASQGLLKQNFISELQNDAHKFASFFADAMKECLDEVSTQIDTHIKSMMINITTATPGPTPTVLACATGPVTGTISVNNLSPVGGITIS